MKKLAIAFLLFSSNIFAAEFMPEKLLFTSPAIDPTEPRTSVMFAFYNMKPAGGKVLDHVGSGSVGGHVPIVGWGNETDGQWQLGLDAAFKALFMLRTPSALVEADGIFGIDFSWKRNKWSFRFRAYHLSTHIGDEYSELTGLKHLEYCTDGFDILASYAMDNGLRVYFGGDYYLSILPHDAGTKVLHFGAEYIHPAPLFFNAHFVALSDFRLLERNDYAPNATGALGLQFSRKDNDRYYARILIEAYTGSSIHSQFYKIHMSYAGVTFQFGILS